jgi:type II secretory pathway pseudopilin PulG
MVLGLRERRDGMWWPPISTKFAIVALVVVMIGASLISSQIHGRQGRRYDRATEVTLRSMETAIRGYKAERGRYPASLQTLVDEKYFDRVFTDAWSRNIRYAVPGANERDYTLMSAGADGEFGTADDLDVWRIGEE